MLCSSLADTVCSTEWLQGEEVVFWEKHALSATLTSKQPCDLDSISWQCLQKDLGLAGLRCIKIIKKNKKGKY